MIQLILVRHGNTFEEGETPRQIGARTDLPLTTEGRKQGEKIGYYLKGLGIEPNALYASGLKRQIEMAQIIGAFFKIGVQKTEALAEIDYGLWEGLYPKEIEKRWGQEHANWNERAEWPRSIFRSEKESHLDHLQAWFRELEKTVGTGVVIGVTSNGILRLLHPEKVKTGHFCKLSIVRGNPTVEGWNLSPK